MHSCTTSLIYWIRIGKMEKSIHRTGLAQWATGTKPTTCCADVSADTMDACTYPKPCCCHRFTALVKVGHAAAGVPWTILTIPRNSPMRSQKYSLKLAITQLRTLVDHTVHLAGIRVFPLSARVEW